MTDQTRFVGGRIPLPLWETFNSSRGERGIGHIQDALIQAVALWVNMNPPSAGVPRVIADLNEVIMSSKAVRVAVDEAIAEWRVSTNSALLDKLAMLKSEYEQNSIQLKLPPDVEEALRNHKG